MMKKRFIAILIGMFLVLMIGSVNADLSWDGAFQNDNQGTQGSDADIFGSTYYVNNLTFGSSSTFSTTSQPVMGNFVTLGNDSYLEIVTHGSCGLALRSGLNASTTISTNNDYCSFGYTIDGIAIVDRLTDGDDELLVVGSTGTTGFVRLYDFYNDGSFQLLKTWTTPYEHTGKSPKCGATYCFVNDINHNLHRFTMPAYAQTSTSYGAFAQDRTNMSLLYDDCYMGNVAKEIVIAGDLDDDGQVDDIAMIRDDTLEILGVKYNILNVGFADRLSIVAPPTCGNLDAFNRKTIGVSAWYGINTYGGWIEYNIVLMDDEFNQTGEKYVLMLLGSYQNHLRPSQVMFDVGKNSSVGTDRILVNFLRFTGGNSYVQLWSIPDFTDLGTVTGGTSGASNQFNSMMKIDVDNNFDGQDDAITNRGHIVHYDIGTDTLTSLGNVPFASNTLKYISAYSDLNTYADFWFVTNTTGNFYQWTDNTGSISTPNPLPDIISWSYKHTIEPNETVQVNVTLTDDGVAGQVRTAFDCESDGTLEYGWGYRGLTPTFYCSFNTTGDKVMKTWASDDDNYPSNTSDTNIVHVQPNAMPYFSSIWSFPNPQLTNHNVVWVVHYLDDGFDSDVRLAFDCETDGTLDYIWGYYTSAPEFNCTYTTIGTKTGTAYLTDIQHITQNVTSNTTVLIISDTAPSSNCSGFTAPSCVLDCFFNDDFNYNYSLLCNDWENIDRTPTLNKLYLLLLNNTHELYQDFELRNLTILDTDYQTFTVEFDFIQDDDDDIYFDFREQDGGNLLTRIYLDLEEVRALQQVAPTDELICGFALGEEVHVEAVFNFTSEKVDIYCKGEHDTLNFYDSGIDQFGYMEISWQDYSQVELQLDNIQISYGSVFNATPSPVFNFTEGASYIQTGNFCAINWTNHTFVEEDCARRGYSDTDEMMQLCFLRACANDVFSFIYYQAQANILKTLVIIIVILLLAPLAVMLWKRTH